jgi:Flp pilus assembly protein TadG
MPKFPLALMSEPPARRITRRGPFLRRFSRADRGSTAVEFALVSVPFMILMFGIVELAMVFLVYTTLESAGETAARQIRTGEFQQSGANTKTDFRTLVCSNMSWLASSCSANLYVDVRTFGNFAALASNNPQTGTAFDPNTTCFTAGEPTDIVLVRIYYKWRLFTPGIDASLQNMGSGSGMRLISTATAFRNEPYNDNAPLGAKC